MKDIHKFLSYLLKRAINISIYQLFPPDITAQAYFDLHLFFEKYLTLLLKLKMMGYQMSSTEYFVWYEYPLKHLWSYVI